MVIAMTVMVHGRCSLKGNGPEKEGNKERKVEGKHSSWVLGEYKLE